MGVVDYLTGSTLRFFEAENSMGISRGISPIPREKGSRGHRQFADGAAETYE
jgi:hypothetical protein